MTKKTAAEEFGDSLRRARRRNSWTTIEPHPQTDEQTERFNRFLMDDLRRARNRHF